MVIKYKLFVQYAFINNIIYIRKMSTCSIFSVALKILMIINIKKILYNLNDKALSF